MLWGRQRRSAHGRGYAVEAHVLPITDLTIVATLLALAVVGSFDAVLLLPIPTFFAWTIVGTLASTAKPIGEITLTSVSRRWVLGAAAIVGVLFVGRSVAQTAAMELYGTGKIKRMELALPARPGELSDPHAPGVGMAESRPLRPGPSSRAGGPEALPQPSGPVAHPP